jgi:hypothetical protein
LATLNFAATDFKAFTPISSALASLHNGAGTVVILGHRTTAVNTDWCGLTDSGPSTWYMTLSQQDGPDKLWSDTNHVAAVAAAGADSDATDWWWHAIDWPGGTATEATRWRDHSTGGTWSRSDTGNDGGNVAASTSDWFRIGFSGDESGTGKDIAVVAAWAGIRFADADYGTWTKTSDLYNHARGTPSLLVECNATTLVDLIGGSTYSSANSSGTTLTGGNPTSYTFDGVGSATVMPELVMAPPIPT